MQWKLMTVAPKMEREMVKIWCKFGARSKKRLGQLSWVSLGLEVL